MTQAVFDGLEDVIPEVVAEAAACYLKHKRAIAASREKMHSALDALIVRMREAGLSQIKIDNGEKLLVLSSKNVVRVKARKKNKDGLFEDGD